MRGLINNFMIYLLDEPFSDNSHSKFLLDVIAEHTQEKVELIALPSSITLAELELVIFDLMSKVLPIDIVLCPWSIEMNLHLDVLFEDMTNLCWVVVAAGNSGVTIEETTPARVPSAITVGCLNKSGQKASLSNFSYVKKIEWVPGTNYQIGNQTQSGTSISSALYAAFLAEGLRAGDIAVTSKLIVERIAKVASEINK